MARETKLLPGLGRAIERFRRARAQVRTEIALGALPEHIQKDIGWPDTIADRMARRFV